MMMMQAQMNTQAGGFDYLIFSNGQQIAKGRATVRDQTHFNYVTQDTSGNSYSGLLHVNHMPN